MQAVQQRFHMRRRNPHAPENASQRQPPRRKHFYSWVATDKTQLETAEKVMLQGLLYYQAKIAGLNTISTDDIRKLDDNAALAANLSGVTNTNIICSCTGEQQATTSLSPLPAWKAAAKDEKEVIVLIHGFAGGVAGWAQNWRFLAERYRVYAFDLPGFARSERRASAAKSLPEAMDYFCDYIHRWFAQLDFRRPVMVLAHSFGCFVASHYAMRHGANCIKLLIFAEPWGLTRGDANRMKMYPLLERALLALFYNVGLLALLRGVGPAGPWMLRRIRPDFEGKWCAFLDDPSTVYDYLYHCNAQNSLVGEKLFKACCHYDVCAKESLLDVLPDTLDKRIAVGLLFGGKSWMNSTEVVELGELLRERGVRVRVYTLADAGHQIFTDDVAGFNKKVSEIVSELSSVPSPTLSA
ncbi:Serine aminopeptidase [Leishmania braziliensis]|nr:Serine aminopeptidase [Leishmania braziliensis]